MATQISLEVMQREWQKVARYSIVRHDNYRSKTNIGGDHTYSAGKKECERLDKLVWSELGIPLDSPSWGNPIHILELKNNEEVLSIYRAELRRLEIECDRAEQSVPQKTTEECSL